jgi:hypothetical protein
LKTQVFVLVPYAIGWSAILDFIDEIMNPHRTDLVAPNTGRFDYQTGVLHGGCFNDQITEGMMPSQLQRSLSKQICAMERLPLDLVPGVLLTPDGSWHDREDYNWRLIDHWESKKPTVSNLDAEKQWSIRYQELIAMHPYCWAIETWVHS